MLRTLAIVALLAAGLPATAQNTFVTPGGASVPGIVTMCLTAGVAVPCAPTGGAIVCTPTGATTTTVSGNTIWTFTSSGSLACPSAISAGSILVVGGGGSGTMGGGGAGGVISMTNASIPTGTSTITVGAGGLGTNLPGKAAGNPGANSSIGSTFVAIGGGPGGQGDAGVPPPTGGSGGGQGSNQSGGPGAPTAGQGNAGGTNGGFTGSFPGGGGGGCGAVGTNATSTTVAGSGGIGCSSSISGAAITYGCGGGGSTYNGSGGDVMGTAGCASAGAGSMTATANNGTANRGGGGGGGWSGGTNGGNGGSGTVVISCPTAGCAAGGGGGGTVITAFNCTGFALTGFGITGTCGTDVFSSNNQPFNMLGASNGSSPGITGTQLMLIPSAATHVAMNVNFRTRVIATSFTTKYTFVANGWNIAFVLNNSTNNPNAPGNPTGFGNGPQFTAGAGCEGGFFQGDNSGGQTAPPNWVFAIQLDQYGYLTATDPGFTGSSVGWYTPGVIVASPPNLPGQSPCNPALGLPINENFTYISTTKFATGPNVQMNTPSNTQNGVNGHTFSATVTYDGSNLTMDLFDVTAGGTCTPTSSGTCFHKVFTGVNIPAVVNGSTAYAGLAAGSNTTTTAPLLVNTWSYTTP